MLEDYQETLRQKQRKFPATENRSNDWQAKACITSSLPLPSAALWPTITRNSALDGTKTIYCGKHNPSNIMHKDKPRQ